MAEGHVMRDSQNAGFPSNAKMPENCVAKSEKNVDTPAEIKLTENHVIGRVHKADVPVRIITPENHVIGRVHKTNVPVRVITPEDCVIGEVHKTDVHTTMIKHSLAHTYSLLCLREVLKSFDVPEVYYSINEYRDDAVCIEHDESGWIIYNGERGEKYNKEHFNNITGACKAMICRLAETEIDKDTMQRLFEKNEKEFPICIEKDEN